MSNQYTLFPDMPSVEIDSDTRNKALVSLGFIKPNGAKSKTTASARIRRKKDQFEHDLFSFSRLVPDLDEGKSDNQECYEKVVWTTTEIAVLHENMMVTMLEDLHDKRASMQTVKEWLLWVEGLENKYGHPLPFSYEASCLFWDVDPDSFRGRIAGLLRKHRGMKISWNEERVSYGQVH